MNSWGLARLLNPAHELGGTLPEALGKTVGIGTKSGRAARLIALSKRGEEDEASMNNQTALVLGILVVGFFAVDFFYLGWDAPIFLGKKFLALIEEMAFWR